VVHEKSSSYGAILFASRYSILLTEDIRFNLAADAEGPSAAHTASMGQPLRSFDEFPEPSRRPRWLVLDVSLVGANGEQWRTVGFGETVGEALTWAQKGAPAGTWWFVSDWTDLFGD
jgi:hypothetical protein